uniref:Uncharacterized protein n=1 Tax=Arion vulgaris TaxID=1028688 RepID=A0A0B7A8Q9_9EUPU
MSSVLKENSAPSVVRKKSENDIDQTQGHRTNKCSFLVNDIHCKDAVVNDTYRTGASVSDTHCKGAVTQDMCNFQVNDTHHKVEVVNDNTTKLQ